MSTISEVIAKLQQMREINGDLNVVHYDTDWQVYYDVCADDEDFVIVKDGKEKCLSVTGRSPYE
jgi:hypothetical protein